MVILQGTMKTEIVYSDDKKERFLLRKIWQEDAPIVSLIMSNPSGVADEVKIDMTTHYVICNLRDLGQYGGVEILNMTSVIQPKISAKNGIKLTDTNLDFILNSVKSTAKTIIAWGRIAENSKVITAAQIKLLDMLKPFEDKLFVISSKSGIGFHPLAPQARFDWQLIPYERPAYLYEKPITEVVTGKSSEPSGDDFTAPLPDELFTHNKGKNSKKDTKTA